MSGALTPVIRGAALLGVGAALGYGLATWENDAPQPAMPSPPAAPALIAADAPEVPTLAFVATGAGQQATTMLLSPGKRAILPMHFVADATSLTLRAGDGTTVGLESIVAVDPVSGLVALDARHADAPAGRLPAVRASLFVGLDVKVHFADAVVPAQVAAPATRNALGGYEYELDLTDSVSRGMAAPISHDGEIAGYLLPADGAGRRTAVDVSSLASLVDPATPFTPVPLAAFAGYVAANTPTGRLMAARAHVEAGRWREALDASHALLRLDPVFGGEAHRLIAAATALGVSAELETGASVEALRLLDDADALLGRDAARSRERGRIYEHVGDIAAAARAYLAAGPSGRAALRTLLARASADALVAEPTLQSLVSAALERDPDYAPYHRILGLSLLRTGRDAAAIAALSRAAALNATLAFELEPLIERARGRLDNPARVDVPVSVQGNVLIVDARLNGSEPRPMLLDTGASYTAISLETALRLGIRNLFLEAPVVGLETANGRIYTNLVRLDSVELGAARAHDVDVVILESMRGVDGLLGQSFLNRFDVDIRRDAGTLSLTPR